MKIADLPQVQRLSVQEKLLLVGELWDEVMAAGEVLAMPEWHKQALDQSLAEYQANPREGSSWNDVRGRILGRP